MALNIPDYFDVVKEPMDLLTMSQNVEKNLYESQQDFEKDLFKIWKNAMLYNQQESDIH